MTKIRLMLVAALLVLVVNARERGEWRDFVVLTWDYPAPLLSRDLRFCVYASDDPTIPKEEWLKMATVVGTNTTARVQVVPGKWFFAVTASNWWGESRFSNVLGLPEPPPSDVELNIRLGHSED